MTDQSMRSFLAALENKGELHHVERNVDTRFEIASVLSLRERGPAQLFTRVNDATMSVVGNLYNDRGRFACALDVPRAGLDALCVSALERPIAPKIVEDAPVQQIVHRQPLDIGSLLPVPHWFEREAAPYITAGVIVAKDPETGRRNVSIARLRLEGGNRLMAGIAKNHHLARIAEKAHHRGHDLEIAVAIGNHAAVLLGSQMYVGLGDDEFDIVGGLLGEPVELVKCKTVDLEVPAHAEIVLEGRLRPADLIEEGAVSEFPGFYVYYGPGIGVEIGCVTHRADAIYQAILPGYAAEHCLLGAVAIGATLTRDLQRSIPAVRRVFVADGGMGRLHAIITMHRPRLGEGKRAVILAMGLVNLLKLVTVVEDDIDPEDPRQVEWSLAARFRGHEDLLVLPGVRADRCDPLHEDLVVTKIGMIATTRPGDGEPGGRSEFVMPPRDVFERIRQNLHLY
ncbi:Putative 3-octaprenyl-4-hydroxybenzoate carboxy-lyase [Rhizobium freirei PRF 81]|uniref:Putative 3-octaprenyl-4-hydroxybenzoate carboxy-lyase n=1 Tax=Rhizobium freirei PRF 81 TaxID=363754 RepID=N6U6Y9_9HYPH|nr:UbiD family decarboxylase [Rhizobium freirei]ENN86008.1 Putative 3-octaprenyl-4-hydroxybenzoate carboxy-lyase [Rhizobium freirei PRF 81]